MSAFTRQPKRFVCQGVQLTRAFDACDPGKYPFLQNVRSIVQGSIQSRDGQVPIANAVFGNPVHTILRFDDPTPFASLAHTYVIGAGASLYLGALAGPFPQVDTGYSGNPLSVQAATPPNSPQPWLYIADASRQRKVNANGVSYPIGIAAPLLEPVVKVQPLYSTIISDFSGVFIPWVNAGTAASAITTSVRVNTTISAILYDSAARPENVSIVPVSMAGIEYGALLTLNGIETAPVLETTIAIASTTIAAILYDAGTTGACTIQPVGSLGTGQLDAPSPFEYLARSGAPHGVLRGTVGTPPAGQMIPITPTPARIRQMDFPVNCLVKLNAELVRIESVALGKDGIQSFRCTTVGTHVAGEAITGVAAFRIDTDMTFIVGQTIQANALRNTITPTRAAAADASGTPIPFTATAGVRTGAGWAPISTLAAINGVATLPEDDLHLAVRLSDCTSVQTVRVYFDIDPAVHDFTQNYFFFEWRSNDILSAIQASNTDPTASITQALNVAVANSQITQQGRPHAGPATQSPQATAGGVGDPNSTQLAIGNNQWIELRCKIKDLIHVGTDTSRTLANVSAAEVTVAISNGTGTAVIVDYDSLWLSGGSGPDVGQVGAPYVYRYRYRSSITGATSNWSPPSRGGVIPRRQQVNLMGTASGDPQADLIDWARFGGALTEWTIAGVIPNGQTFPDAYADSAISGGEPVVFDQMQPWPVQDLPRAGTCNIAGSAIRWVSGDQFNAAWAPGSAIVVNGQVFTLYSQPPSATLLFVTENAGSGIGVSFKMPGPTLLSQTLGSIWGGPVAGATFLFACQDPINPGHVRWTVGNNADLTAETNDLEVTPPSEPLQNGFLHDGTPYVASTENIYVLEPIFAEDQPFRPLITPCGRGFWAPWAFALAPEGVYFLAKDGIYLTAGGSVAKSITDADLYPLFPHDGVPGEAVNGYQPVDMTQTASLRIAYVDGYVYFDYLDTNAAARSLCYRVADASWWPDVYGAGVHSRINGQGRKAHEMLMGSTNGQVYRSGGVFDTLDGIVSVVQVVDDQGDVRRQKLYRDLMLDAERGGAVTVTLGVDNNGTIVATENIPGIAGRHQYDIDIDPTIGAFGRNLTSTFTWVAEVEDTITLFAYDIAYQPCPELASSWLSGPTTLGLKGYGQIPMVLLTYRAAAAVTFSVIIDGVLYTYPLPDTGNLYAKKKIVLQSVKGKTFQFGAQSSQPFMLWDTDFEAWVQQWAAPGGYSIARPF